MMRGPWYRAAGASARSVAGKNVVRLASAVAALLAVGWLGLRVKATPFPAYPRQARTPDEVPLPDDLPPPVARFYRRLYGEKIPVIESALLTGRATLRIGGLTLPARFRFVHLAGRGYRHYIEATWFGIPFLKVNERYLDGIGVGELPFGVVESGPKQDQGANLGMWAESFWFPALFLTDPRVHWEPINEVTALLVVPFGDEKELFIVHFDPHSGLVASFESLRYQGSTAPEKRRWINVAEEWERANGTLRLRGGSALWQGDRAPWATFTVEELRLNVDLAAYVRQRGI